MKKLLLFAIFISLLSPMSATQQDEKLLRHVVLFSWKADAPEETVREIESAFAALPSKIDAIHSFEWGTDNSPEGLANGFTHCFLVTFASEEGRAAYLPHPAHRAFVDLMKPYMEKVLVIDYWQKE